MTTDTWNTNFLDISPLFDTIQPVASPSVQLSQWPDLEFYKQQFTQQGLIVNPVQQAEKPQSFIDHYEPRIYLKHELQTRTENWHDYFNAMIWLSFPETKTTLNELHYHAAKKRTGGTNRSPIENAITLFDECGIIIISEKTELLEMIQKHEWKKLFFHHRNDFATHVHCIVFGHAMYEKALSPYIGMTAQALLIHSSELEKQRLLDLKSVDHFISDYWKSDHIKTTKDLSPFPLLGVPGWHSGNEVEEFYENKEYFRPPRA
jgi:hypothetical protein